MMFYCFRRKIRFFFQRLFRGFDDSETWDLEKEFYKWLLPRLKRFKDITKACPCNMEYKDWKNMLSDRVAQLNCIVNIDENKFQDRSYIPKQEYKKLLKRFGNSDILNNFAYDWCVNDFNKWFYENIINLWW